MKYQMRIGCLSLLALLTFSVNLRAAEDAENLNLRKAQSITFYSGSTLHSWFECNAALDSLNQWEPSIMKGGIADSLRLERMRMELALGMDNSSANMNGVFPSFGAMTSQRLDYHFIDDPGEVLAEDLVGEFIDMPSKSRKGSYRDNGVFMIVSTSDGNIELANVLMDFLGSQTSAYVVRPHELSGLVPCALEDGPCLQRMDSAEWSGILDYYNTDDVLLLTIEEKQAFSSNVSYRGLRVERYSSGAKGLMFENYLEGFKTDKKEASTHVIWLLILGMLVSFLVLTALGLFDYSEGEFFYVRDWQTALHAKKNVFAIVCSAIVVNASFWIAGEFAPALNEYIWAPSAMLWVAAIICLPPIAAMILTYIAMWKLMKDWAVNEMANYSRLIQAAYLAAYVWFFSANLVAEPDGNVSVYFMELGLASVFTLSPSWVIGKVIAQVANGAARPKQLALGITVAVFSWVLLGVAMLFSICNQVELSNWLHLGGFALAVGYLVVLPKLSGKSNSDAEAETQMSHGLHNPVDSMTKGLNWHAASQALDHWLENRQSSVFILRGSSGSGKTRFLKEWRESTRNADRDCWVMFGDFQETHDDEVVDFEPFVEAVNSIEESNNDEWKGFSRTDRKQLNRV